MTTSSQQATHPFATNGDQSVPHKEYTSRLEARRQEVQAALRREGVSGNLRLLAFAGILLVAYLVFGPLSRVLDWWGLLVIAAAVALFYGVVLVHRRVVKDLTRSQTAVAYYRRALRRVDDQWSGTGPTGVRFAEASHPYSGDLDVFGTGSLFQLLSSARTPVGEEALAAMLLRPPRELSTVEARQQAVLELRDAIDLREQLAVLPTTDFRSLNPQDLLSWVQAPPRLTDIIRPWLAGVLGLLTGITLLGWGLWGWGSAPFVLALIPSGILLATLRKDLIWLAKSSERALADLELLADVLALLERQKFTSPLLQEILQELQSGDGRTPSQEISRLKGQMENFQNSLRNQIVAPVAFLFLLIVHILYGIERWRHRVGPQVEQWLDATGRFEALLSLSGYAYERPLQVMPRLLETGPFFQAESLGHPLLPDGGCVRNDIVLNGEPQLLLVSGSNMSGKSTLMRCLGLNAVLAFAGAPVRATSMDISLLQVGTAMRVQDSLQTGTSHFFAELKRIRSVVDLASGPLPLLFLFDEILHGTNSHDRLVGADAIINRLLDTGAIGVVSTHDLALAEIANRRGDQANNVHFADQLVNGRMTFDYKMRPGVVPKSNALALMRELGLEV